MTPRTTTRTPRTTTTTTTRAARTRTGAVTATARHGAEPPPPATGVRVRCEGDRCDVVLTGDVDLVVAGDLALALTVVRRYCARPTARVHVDVRRVRALDSTGLRFVADLRRACAQAGAPCSTSRARPVVQRALDLVPAGPDGRSGRA